MSLHHLTNFLYLMIRLLFLLITFQLTLQDGNSQELKLRGRVFNLRNEPIPFVTVTLSDKITKIKCLSDEKGMFAINAQPGVYNLSFSRLGKILYSKEITIKDNQDLGAIQLDDSFTLANATVSFKKPLIERKVDRLIFNVANSIISQGADAIDVLSVTPNINVRNDEISMPGKSNMLVTINNRQLMLSGRDLINYLKTLRSDDIKNIEIITNPPAKFEASGNSGIVNINMKKAGLNDWSANIGASIKQSRYLQTGQSVGLTYNKNDISAYASFSRMRGLFLARQERSLIWYTDRFYDSYSDIKTNYGSNHNLNGGVDYTINKMFSIGAQFNESGNMLTEKEHNEMRIFASPSYLMNTVSQTHKNYNRKAINVHSIIKVDTLGSNIAINVDYFRFKPDQIRVFETEYYDKFINHLPENDYRAQNNSLMQLENISGQVDIEHKKTSWEISYGGRLSRTKTNSYINFFNLDGGLPVFDKNKSDVFNYHENIQSLYLSGAKRFIEHWEAKFGIRLENTKTIGLSQTLSTRVTNAYLRLFPTLFLLYNVDNRNTISFNYGRRINRPSYQSLNPFVRYINQFTTSEGNPFLRAYCTDNFELAYKYGDNVLTTLYFSQSKRKYDQVNYIRNEDITNSTRYVNFFDDSSFGLIETLSLRPINGWENIISANVYYRKVKSSLPEAMAGFKNWSAFFKTNNDFSLNKKKSLFGSVNYWYQMSDYYSINKTKAYSSTDLGLKAILFAKRLSMSLYASDIFKTSKIRTLSTFDGIINSFENYEDRRSVRFSVRYTIGKNNFKQKTIRNSNTDEKERAN